MSFHTIGIVARQGDKTIKTFQSLVDYLRNRKCEILLEKNTAQQQNQSTLPAFDSRTLCQKSDLIIVIGGDGTLLGTARNAVIYDTPILGINLGRLGFLVDISPDEMLPSLNHVFEGRYEVDKRSVLEVCFEGEQHSELAINDVVLHKWNTARLIEFETSIDGLYVERQRSDGLIIATPTGSTAYALSGGGPLIHPSLDAFAIVPICPHTLSNRPIVIDGKSEISIKVCGETPADQVRITCDGQQSLALPEDHKKVLIKRHQRTVRLIHPPGHDHYSILRNKLGWGKHHTN